MEKITPEAAEQLGEAAPEQKKDDAIEPPFKGFVESEGRTYFLVKIDARFGYLSILGFLQEAGDYLKFHIAKQREQASRIIKPTGKGMGGRFLNLIRGK